MSLNHVPPTRINVRLGKKDSQSWGGGGGMIEMHNICPSIDMKKAHSFKQFFLKWV